MVAFQQQFSVSDEVNNAQKLLPKFIRIENFNRPVTFMAKSRTISSCFYLFITVYSCLKSNRVRALLVHWFISAIFHLLPPFPAIFSHRLAEPMTARRLLLLLLLLLLKKMNQINYEFMNGGIFLHIDLQQPSWRGIQRNNSCCCGLMLLLFAIEWQQQLPPPLPHPPTAPVIIIIIIIE